MCSLTVGNCFTAHLLRREYPVLFKIYIRILTFLSNIIDQIGRLLMWRPRPEGVKNMLNIRYGDEKWARYDLHYRDDGKQKPLFIYIHGGGFVSGDKSVCRYYCYEYAQRGYAAMNINYQFAPEAKHPDQLRQIFSAIEHLLDRADEYNIDTSRVVVAGESAGAYFSTYVAGISKKRKYYKYFGIDFKYADTFSVSACVLICGIYRLKDALYFRFSFIQSYFRALTGKTFSQMRRIYDERFFDKFSPLNLVDGSFPPSVIIHATHDSLKVESEFFADRLDLHRVPYLHYPAGGIASRHAFPINTRCGDGKRGLELTVKFLDKYVNKAEERNENV